MFYAVLISGLATLAFIILQILSGKSSKAKNKTAHVRYLYVVVIVVALVHIMLGLSAYGQ